MMIRDATLQKVTENLIGTNSGHEQQFLMGLLWLVLVCTFAMGIFYYSSSYYQQSKNYSVHTLLSIVTSLTLGTCAAGLR